MRLDPDKAFGDVRGLMFTASIACAMRCGVPADIAIDVSGRFMLEVMVLEKQFLNDDAPKIGNPVRRRRAAKIGADKINADVIKEL